MRIKKSTSLKGTALIFEQVCLTSMIESRFGKVIFQDLAKRKCHFQSDSEIIACRYQSLTGTKYFLGLPHTWQR
jgi:hypothetical protein